MIPAICVLIGLVSLVWAYLIQKHNNILVVRVQALEKTIDSHERTVAAQAYTIESQRVMMETMKEINERYRKQPQGRVLKVHQGGRDICSN